MAWQSQPIFISSTFADMQAERDHLRTHVFPALEEHLRARRRHLEWVDLRLGVATAALDTGEARELQVLKVCLAEVRRCRPFLIVLLGDRYGWVPPAERIAAAAREEGFGGDIVGRSVTDLEIRFGILEDAEQQPRSIFYCRAPLPYAAMPPAIAALYSDAYGSDPDADDRTQRLAGLKHEIETRLPDRVRRYAVGWDSGRLRVNGLDDWGRSVVQDILSELDKDAALADADVEVSWQQAERIALDDYIEDRARDFVGRQQILSRLENVATAPAKVGAAWGLCLTGEPGSGKSAIFGELHRRLKTNNLVVLAHAAGASPRAPSVDDMLRRWIDELGAALGADPGLADNADPDTIDTTFHALLGRMAEQHRVVVLVDALDQFEATTRARFMTWLPRVWPLNARLIATAIPGEATQALGERAGAETIPLPPLDQTDALLISKAICGRYHRTLEPDVLDALMAKTGQDGPAWGNSLWLVLAIEELNLVDADDFARATRSYTGAPAEQLRALMLDIVAELPTDVLGLYTATIERTEQLFGIYLARAFLGFITVSRAGWRESDFRALLPRVSGESWDELRFAALRRLLRGQIRQRGTVEQWDFNHAQVRAAVRQSLAAQSVVEAEFHAEVVEHLLALSVDDPLRQTETMVHLLGAEDWSRAATFYGAASLTEPELTGATRVLADTILSQANGVDRVLRLLDTAADGQIGGTVAERLIFELHDGVLADRAQLSDREALLVGAQNAIECLAKADPGNAGWQRDLSVSHDQIGDVLRAQGNLPAALDSYQASLAIADRLAKADPGNAGWQRDLSVSHDRIGDVLVAQGNLPAALDSYQASLAIRDRLAKADPGNAGWQRDLSLSHDRIGDMLVAQGNLPAALESYQASLAIADRLAKADPGNAGWQRDLGTAHQQVGDILREQGDLPGALTNYEATLAIKQRFVISTRDNASAPRDLSVTHNRVGEVLAAQGLTEAALAAYSRSLGILEHLAEKNPHDDDLQRDLDYVHNRIGETHLAEHNSQEALESYMKSLVIRERLASSATGSADARYALGATYDRIGDLLRNQGDGKHALAAFQAANDIIERLVVNAANNKGWQRDLVLSREKVARSLRDQGDHQGALGFYKGALAAIEVLAVAEPGNVNLQIELVTACGRVGEMHRWLGQKQQAYEAFNRGYDIVAPLAVRYPDATQLTNLVATFEQGIELLRQ